ncbi:MAG: RNA polymerase sigma factor, partial [bacterium]
KKLAPKFRAVIVLRLIQGYSTKEVAEILNIPAGTVLSRLARAQKKLKQLLTPFIEEVA